MKNTNEQFKLIRKNIKILDKEFLHLPKIKKIQYRMGRLVVLLCDARYINIFSTEEKTDIINTLTLAYLNLWLENDENARQTIYSFSCKQFMLKDESKKPLDPLNEDIRNQVTRGKNILDLNILIQNLFSRRIGIPYKMLNRKQNGGKEYSFLDLENMYALGNGSLDVYRNIFKNSRPYQSTCKNKKFGKVAREDIVKQSYENYDIYLSNIRNLINKDKKSPNVESNNREFVVKCLLVWKNEYSYRFSLTAKLAKFLKDNNIPLNDVYIPQLIKEYCDLRSVPIVNKKEKMFYSYFIKNYDGLIRSAYSMENDFCINYIVKAREIVDEIFSLYCQIFKSKNLGSWSDDDFEDAAQFLIDEYGIEECLMPLELGEVTDKNNSYYSYIRKLFDISDYIDSGQLEFFKSEKNKRKDNKK